MSDEPLDGELLSAAIAGQRVALERLLLRSHDRLAGAIAQRIPPELRGLIQADDVLQETFTAAFRMIGSFQPRGDGAFFHWLSAIAENRLLDMIKAQRAAKRGGGRAAVAASALPSPDSAAVLLDALAIHSGTPSGLAAGQEAAQAVAAALEEIEPDYRTALRLRYFEGLSVAQVAERMERTERAVHMLCHRGLGRLREVLGRSSKYFSA